MFNNQNLILKKGNAKHLFLVIVLHFFLCAVPLLTNKYLLKIINCPKTKCYINRCIKKYIIKIMLSY